MVGAELQLKAVDRQLAPWRRHDGGIVDEQVQAALGGAQPRSERLDGLKAGEVHGLEAHLGRRHAAPYRFDCSGTLLRIAPGNDDPRTSPGERQCVVEAQASSAGDDRGAACLRGDVRCGPGRHVSSCMVSWMQK
jgi:hypothetical protein